MEESRVVALYDRWGLAVYRRALRLLGDRDEARDVMQEAFISLVQGLARVEDDAAALGLLYQAATFQAIDRVRRQSRWSSRLARLKPAVHAGEDEASHETEARQVEAAQDLALLTRGEPPEVLRAALLHFVGGYTLEEVGTSLALSGRTVARMLGRLSERARKRGARLGGLEGWAPRTGGARDTMLRHRSPAVQGVERSSACGVSPCRGPSLPMEMKGAQK